MSDSEELNTSLWYAIETDDTEEIRMLIDSGADVNAMRVSSRNFR